MSTSSDSIEAGVPRPKLDEKQRHPSEYLEFATLSSLAGGPDYKSSARATVQDEPDSPTVRPKFETTQSSDDLFVGLNESIPGFKDLSAEAQSATQAEHKMTFTKGVQLYPKAILWSALLSLTIVMEGYDVTLITSFFGFQVFRQHYGTQVRPNNYQISPPWQSGLTNGSVAGEIIGLIFNGWLTERFGYHRTIVGALVWLSLSVSLAFFAFNIEMLLASEILCGLSWGIFQTLSTTYAAEVMPVALRAYLTSNVNMCWLIGQLISVGIVRGVVHNQSEWSYRIPFGLQWAFSVPLLIAVLMAPESPWWLVRHGRDEDAKKSLARLTQRDETLNLDETIAMMKHTNEVEKYLSAGMDYTDCFKGTDLRRTEIACMVWVSQALSGSVLTGYAPYFYEQANFSSEQAFDLSTGMYGLAICGGFLAWYLMKRVGRRTLYLWGLMGCVSVLLVAGGISTRPDTQGVSWALGSLVILLTFVYDVTIGPVCYTLVAEIPSTRLRAKTVVLARVAYNIVSLITNIVTPRMLNPEAWNLKGKSCFIWAVTAFACFVWCYFRLPEPMGLTYMELDILFSKKAKARKFRQFQVHLAETGYFSLTEAPDKRNQWRGNA